MKEKNLSLKRVILALCLMAVCWVPARAEVLVGDVDNDGRVNITDVVKMINAVMSENWDSINQENADINGDGVWNITDVTSLINIIMNMPDHEWVDLGLPSGTLWAKCNVGAERPEDFGDYFAWGETEPKEVYTWETYKLCNGSYSTLTKYCTNSTFGIVDNVTELKPEDDAASVNWSSSWCIPTLEQLKELIDNCTWTWTTRNGVDGRLVTGPNGNTLFLPAAGNYRETDSSILDEGTTGYYWSSTLSSLFPVGAGGLGFNSERVVYYEYNGRNFGWSVRPVRVSHN